MNVGLWIVQAVLAALFGFAGAMKFAPSGDQMAQQMGYSSGFMHFIGAAEVLGGLGLVLPGLLKIAKWLTPLAAMGLFIIMIGAVRATMGSQQVAVPAVTGLLCLFVIWGRKAWR